MTSHAKKKEVKREYALIVIISL